MSRTRLFAHLKSTISKTSASENPFLQTRREFLKNSAVVTVAAAAPYRLPYFATALPGDPVLILGAGAAGLAAAWELQKAGIPFRILEASSRIGGRIFTQTGFTQDGQFIERGGELIDTDHAPILKLAGELGVPIERLDGDGKGLEQILYSVRGQIYTDADLDRDIGPLIQAVDETRKQGAGGVTYKDGQSGNMQALQWDRLTLQEFLDGLRGRVADWLLETVSLGYMMEFGRHSSELSYLCLVNLIAGAEGGIFGPSDETMRIAGGNSRLIEKLKSTLEMHNPRCIEMGAQVVSIADRGSKLALSYVQNGITKEVSSARVICTVPFSVLRMVDGLDRLAFSPQKRACIAKLAYGQNSKTMLEFTSKPWREKAGKLPPYNGALTGDFASQDFWETSRMQKGSHGIITCFQGGAGGMKASPLEVESVILPDLENFHPGITKKYVKAAVQNWNLVPTIRGSYSCLLAGHYGEIQGAQGETELDGRLLFAGEHCSDESQGYMNGAVETGVLAAHEVIKKMASAPAV